MESDLVIGIGIPPDIADESCIRAESAVRICIEMDESRVGIVIPPIESCTAARVLSCRACTELSPIGIVITLSLFAPPFEG